MLTYRWRSWSAIEWKPVEQRVPTLGPLATSVVNARGLSVPAGNELRSYTVVVGYLRVGSATAWPTQVSDKRRGIADGTKHRRSE